MNIRYIPIAEFIIDTGETCLSFKVKYDKVEEHFLFKSSLSSNIES